MILPLKFLFVPKFGIIKFKRTLIRLLHVVFVVVECV